MPAVKVAECETAADVWRLARESAARRRAWNAPKQPIVPPALAEMEILAEVVAVKKRSFPIEWLGRTSAQIQAEMDLAEKLSEPIKQVRPSVADLIRAVACAYGVSAQTIKSGRRTMDVVHTRHVSMLLCKIIFDHSYPRIARDHGRLDHSTALHGCRKLAWLAEKLRALHTDADPISAWAVTAARLHPIPGRGRCAASASLPYRNKAGQFQK
jgi:hypothetical protein